MTRRKPHTFDSENVGRFKLKWIKVSFKVDGSVPQQKNIKHSYMYQQLIIIYKHGVIMTKIKNIIYNTACY